MRGNFQTEDVIIALIFGALALMLIGLTVVLIDRFFNTNETIEAQVVNKESYWMPVANTVIQSGNTTIQVPNPPIHVMEVTAQTSKYNDYIKMDVSEEVFNRIQINEKIKVLYTTTIFLRLKYLNYISTIKE